MLYKTKNRIGPIILPVAASEIPTDADFDKTVGDYLSFEFSMIMQGRQYLFDSEE